VTGTIEDDNTSEGDGLTRRRLIRLGLLAAGAGAVAIPAGNLGGFGVASAADLGRRAFGTRQSMPEAFLRSAGFEHMGTSVSSGAPQSVTGVDPAVLSEQVSTPVRTTHPSVAPTQHARQPARPVRPTWLSTWNQPVYRLDDFLARSKGTHLPSNAIMLTIDDGPSQEWTPKYLRLLAKYNVQATFCVIGQQVREFPYLVKAAVTEGHHIANHTYHHPLTLPNLSVARIRSEMVDTTDAIVRASGFHPRQFRAPGGDWGPKVFTEAARQEMLPLGWDIDPRDWSLPGVAHIRSAMLAARPHDIVLCHDGGGNRAETYAALETVIPALKARGWTFVTLPSPQIV
jgi:peptidoglycan/xylan/chitin deacetylase (PgdA/CDA1 family)